LKKQNNNARKIFHSNWFYFGVIYDSITIAKQKKGQGYYTLSQFMATISIAMD